MNPIRRAILGLSICACGVWWVTAVRGAADAPAMPEIRTNEPAAGSGARPEANPTSDLEAARRRAELMHETYEATLEMLHHRYFHRDRSLLPARAMEDIFADMKRRTKVEARWISVNTKAMNIDHEPKSDFEKLAAREIASGKPAFESVEDDMFRRATAIPLKSGCVGCHAGAFAASSKSPKFAGLVISVPIEAD